MQVLSDREIAMLVNTLTSTAKAFHDTKQLRQRISDLVVPVLKERQTLTAWDSTKICRWIASQMTSKPVTFNRTEVAAFIRSLGKHPQMLKHVPVMEVRTGPSYEELRDLLTQVASLIPPENDEAAILMQKIDKALGVKPKAADED